MSEIINTILNKCTNWISNLTIDAAGKGLVFVGTHIEEVAMILIAIGALLLICRQTKVLRWGLISYLLGLLVELIGIAITK